MKSQTLSLDRVLGEEMDVGNGMDLGIGGSGRRARRAPWRRTESGSASAPSVYVTLSGSLCGFVSEYNRI